jgi:hypothetical protein
MHPYGHLASFTKMRDYTVVVDDNLRAEGFSLIRIIVIQQK